jgi:hypothetical protein
VRACLATRGPAHGCTAQIRQSGEKLPQENRLPCGSARASLIRKIFISQSFYGNCAMKFPKKRSLFAGCRNCPGGIQRQSTGMRTGAQAFLPVGNAGVAPAPDHPAAGRPAPHKRGTRRLPEHPDKKPNESGGQENRKSEQTTFQNCRARASLATRCSWAGGAPALQFFFPHHIALLAELWYVCLLWSINVSRRPGAFSGATQTAEVISHLINSAVIPSGAKRSRGIPWKVP